MEAITYRGRTITAPDIDFIKSLIAEHPEASRFELSKRLCLAWSWVQPNGHLKDMVCRSLMLKLHRAGLIELPAPRSKAVNNVITRRKRKKVSVDSSPISCGIPELGEIAFLQVRGSRQEAVYDSLIEEHHYLGYSNPVGEHLKYLVYACGGRPIACFGWSSAWRRLGIRDRYIGWSDKAREKNLQFLAYNTRFLLVPWVKVRHLASHLLGRMARIISADWERIYGHPVYYLESFVEVDRFAGTSYRAANWGFLGRSSGRGTRAETHKATVAQKEVLGLALRKDFRELLSHAG